MNGRETPATRRFPVSGERSRKCQKGTAGAMKTVIRLAEAPQGSRQEQQQFRVSVARKGGEEDEYDRPRGSRR